MGLNESAVSAVCPRVLESVPSEGAAAVDMASRLTGFEVKAGSVSTDRVLS